MSRKVIWTRRYKSASRIFFCSRRPSVSFSRDSCTEVDTSCSKEPTLTKSTRLGVYTCTYITFYNTWCKRYLGWWYRNDNQSAKSFFPTIPFEKLYLRVILSFFHTYYKACLKRFMAKKPGKKKKMKDYISEGKQDTCNRFFNAVWPEGYEKSSLYTTQQILFKSSWIFCR